MRGCSRRNCRGREHDCRNHKSNEKETEGVLGEGMHDTFSFVAPRIRGEGALKVKWYLCVCVLFPFLNSLENETQPVGTKLQGVIGFGTRSRGCDNREKLNAT